MFKREQKAKMGRRLGAILCCVLVQWLFHSGCNAQGTQGNYVPTRYGLVVGYGQTYDKSEDIGYALVTGVAEFDYDRIWHHPAPESLRFKVEMTLGATTRPWVRGLASVNMMATCYLDRFANARVRPYVEGGIGVIYTDFKVDGQGLKFNFNPQLGAGMELPTASGQSWFAAIRLHHVSNGGLDRENTGIDSVLLTLGRFF
jgi:hypothetical protein